MTPSLYLTLWDDIRATVTDPRILDAFWTDPNEVKRRDEVRRQLAGGRLSGVRGDGR